ncbi:hypothetical protein PR202_ga12944 [Eleusine coracana subsp. coracana]|uniref:Gnk2-homologous domain-containing protein n=1 Tax=Eleusine coracana subsp. coracana TaxID=191504 RepID=A0AAV5CDE0_ELECO|nr:hypothetical protein PR202_ga12944 [Eleusine coracana subsp. coracana]
MATMISVVYLLLLTLFCGRNNAFSFRIVDFDCFKSSSYGLNSTCNSNVLILLSSLATKESSSSPGGFATGTLGGAPDQLRGPAPCRGDGNSYASFHELAPDYAFDKGTVDDCRGVKFGSIYFYACLLSETRRQSDANNNQKL